MKKILVLEDEASIRSFVVINLKRAGYETIEAGDGEEALEQIRKNPDIKVALLDIMLPGELDGFEVCRRIRAGNAQIGIIMLTARGDEADKVKGLSFGADDYMTKPFSVPELMARISALLRRTIHVFPTDKIKTFRDMTIDYAKHRVTRDSQDIHLGPTEFRLLQFLMEKPGDVLSREHLLKSVWGGSIYVELRTVDVHIRRLRNALNKGGRPDLIRTVRSMGYAMDLGE